MHQLRNLPNTEGYRFQLILKDGTQVLCQVFKDPVSGFHYLAPVLENRAGWIQYQEQEKA